MAEEQERLSGRAKLQMDAGSLPSRAEFKRALLVPLGIGIALMLAIFVVAETLRERQAVDTARERTVAAVLEAFDLAIRRDSDKLGAALDGIQQNAYLRNIFIAGDRESLFKASKNLFDGLRRDHNITHFYFISNDRRMFLRVQRPDSFGDIIARTTLLQTEKTGKPSTGLELGQKGVFTLRVVEPWLDAVGQRIGYIELGMEIDRTLAQLHELTGADLFLLVDKRNLDRAQWEEGMDMIGHLKNWDLLPEQVVAGRTKNANDTLLAAHPGASQGGKALEGRHRARIGERAVEFGSLPLTDAGGRSVGTVLMAHDLTAMESRQERFLTIIGIAALLVAAAMLALGNHVLNRLYARLTPSPDIHAVKQSTPTHIATTADR